MPRRTRAGPFSPQAKCSPGFFAVDHHQINRRVSVIEEINHPRPAALAAPRSAPPDFANTAGFGDEVAGFRVCGDVKNKGISLLVAPDPSGLFRKGRRFDDCDEFDEFGYYPRCYTPMAPSSRTSLKRLHIDTSTRVFARRIPGSRSSASRDSPRGTRR